MRYGSVCSGIEAATVAWHPLGWKPAFFSEIDKFPRAVLQHHYPDVPLHGDFTTIGDDDYGTIDLLVGGTPCQSFSIAGLRGGLGDDRGNLALEYLRLAGRKRPRWLVWENVPGVLSSNGGRDFGSILGGLVELGYGFAYRILDAQYVRTQSHPRAVPQRRRRVFVVGYLGDWRRAAAVLFDRESLSGNPPPRREAGQGPAPTLSARPSGGGGLGTDFDLDGGLVANSGDVSMCITASAQQSLDAETETLIATVSGDGNTHALMAEGFDASEDGSGRGTPIIGFPAEMSGTQAASTEDLSPALSVKHTTAVAFDLRGRDGGAQFEGPHATANIRAASGGSSRSYVADRWAVRRLTPVECERLQGFPDGYTNVPWRGKDHAPDGPRYKALGNSMAVNVMRWIGDRIQMVDAL